MTESSPSSRGQDGQLLSPGDEVDRYVVDGVIGSGGTATVYRVHHRELGTVYALKVLGLLSASIRRRTLQEGRVQARLRHRNVVGVYDVLDVGGAPGLLMEHVHGPTLESALSRHRFSLAHAELLFRGIVAGVRAAHAEGLVHRDMKPANVLLAETPDGLVPKVADFGIAKVVEAGDIGHTRAGIAMGTPQYMAPEQIRDARSVDMRADIFSLGCILYELVTGERVFPYDDILKVYNAVCDGEYVSAKVHVPDLPPGILAAIDGALVVERDQRIPDCNTLLEVFDGRRTWSLGEPTDMLPLAESEETVVWDSQAVLPADLLDDPSDDVPMTAMVEETLVTLPPERPLGVRRGLAILAMLAAAMLFAALWLASGQPRGAPPAGEMAVAIAPVQRTLHPSPSEAVPDPITTPEPEAAPEPVAEAAAAAMPPVPRPIAVAKPAKPVPALPPVARATPRPAPPAPKITPPPASPVLTRLFTLPRTATLSIDGQQVGRTPHKVELATGRHKVRVQSGERTASFTIEVKQDADNRWCYVFDDDTPVRGSCPR